MVRLPSGRYLDQDKIISARWHNDRSNYTTVMFGQSDDLRFSPKDGLFIERVLEGMIDHRLQHMGEPDRV